MDNKEVLWLLMHFEIEGKTYPMERVAAHENTLYVSPHSGRVWASAFRSLRFEWYPKRAPAPGERAWAGMLPGSLLTSYEIHTELLDELSAQLLWRELLLLRDLTTSTNHVYNIESMGGTMNEIADRIAQLRAKEAAGTITIEELREAFRLMRENRIQKAAARKKAGNPDELLKDFIASA